MTLQRPRHLLHALPMTNREELYKLHLRACAVAFGIMMKKNQDYGANNDALRNFRDDGLPGILTRKGDKRARLKTWAERETFAVTDEGFVEDVLDDINYSVLALAWYLEQTGDTAAMEAIERRFGMVDPGEGLTTSPAQMAEDMADGATGRDYHPAEALGAPKYGRFTIVVDLNTLVTPESCDEFCNLVNASFDLIAYCSCARGCVLSMEEAKSRLPVPLRHRLVQTIDTNFVAPNYDEHMRFVTQAIKIATDRLLGNHMVISKGLTAAAGDGQSFGKRSLAHTLSVLEIETGGDTSRR